MKAQRRKGVSKGKLILCAHTIEWRLEGKGLRLSDMDTEQITNMLIENYVEGEICTITPTLEKARGYWNIVN